MRLANSSNAVRHVSKLDALRIQAEAEIVLKLCDRGKYQALLRAVAIYCGWGFDHLPKKAISQRRWPKMEKMVSISGLGKIPIKKDFRSNRQLLAFRQNRSAA